MLDLLPKGVRRKYIIVRDHHYTSAPSRIYDAIPAPSQDNVKIQSGIEVVIINELHLERPN